MSPEQLKQQFPETFNIIFQAGMKAGQQAESGVLPAPGTNAEFDQYNAAVEKQLNNNQ